MPAQPPAQNHDELEGLLRQRIEAQQATGVLLLDDLAVAQPKSSAEFARELEAHLLLHWHDYYDPTVKERPMTYEEKPKRKNDQRDFDNDTIQPDRPKRSERQRSLAGTLMFVLIVLGAGATSIMLMSMSGRTGVAMTFGSYGPATTKPRNIQPESTIDLFASERTAEATRVVFIDPTVIAPQIQEATDVIQTVTQEAINLRLTATRDPSNYRGSGAALAMPTSDDPVIRAATDVVATVTQESIEATATAGRGFPVPTLTPVGILAPTNEDPVIQAATNIVATVTHEAIYATAMANGIFGLPTPTPMGIEGPISAAAIDIPQNWLTIGVPMQLIESTDGRVVQGGVVRLISTADSDTADSDDSAPAAVARLALVVDQREDSSGLANQLYFAVSGEDALDLVQVISTTTPLRIEVLSETGLVPVVISRRNILAGTTLSADMLSITYYPLDVLPDATYKSIAEAVGQGTTLETAKGFPIYNVASLAGSGMTLSNVIAVEEITATTVSSGEGTSAVSLDSMATLIVATITQQALEFTPTFTPQATEALPITTATP